MTVILGILLQFLLQPIAALEITFTSNATGFWTSRKSEYFSVVIKSQPDSIKALSGIFEIKSFFQESFILDVKGGVKFLTYGGLKIPT